MEGVSQRMLSDASQVDDAVTTGTPFRNCGAHNTTHTIEWGDAVSTGEVTIETADNENYTGTWKAVTNGVIAYSGSSEDVLYVPGAYGAFRHRITSPLNDGAFVTSKIRGAL